MNFHLTLKSANAKTGPIAVSTSPSSTCPDNCGLKHVGCYGKFGPLGLHWKQVDLGNRGGPWQHFLSQIRSIPDGSAWRHNQVGDLPGDNNRIDCTKLRELTTAQAGRRGWTYTHKPMTRSNAAAVEEANAAGFTINLSADTVAQADQLKALQVAPVVVIVPRRTTAVSYTPAGNKVVICPAQQRDDISCDKCMLCQRRDRSVIVGFYPHGTKARSVEAMCDGGAK